jgi:hypothetical protein
LRRHSLIKVALPLPVRCLKRKSSGSHPQGGERERDLNDQQLHGWVRKAYSADKLAQLAGTQCGVIFHSLTPDYFCFDLQKRLQLTHLTIH